jgi:DNA-binding transcriptional regulator YhcF (GntR family)
VIIEVDASSAVPPYEQIREQVTTMAATGVLPTGARIPPIRQLARDLGLANGTVARAYRELEGDGVIESRGRHGTFVLGPGRRAARNGDDSDRLDEIARAFAVAVHQLRTDHDRALEAVRRALRRLQNEVA